MICRICRNSLDTDNPVMNLQIREALPEDVKLPFYMCKNCENLSASDILTESFNKNLYKHGKYALPKYLESIIGGIALVDIETNQSIRQTDFNI